MEIEKRFIENYLTHRKYSYGKLFSFLFIGLCVVFSQFYWDQSLSLSQYLSANPKLVFEENELWRLFSTSFVHGGIEHLLSNSLMLFILTYFVTSFYGASVSFGLGILAGAIINAFVIMQYENNTTLVGASGIVFFLWGFWLILYLFIETQYSWPSRLLRVFGVFIILLVPTSYVPNTSYLAHYFGFILGLAFGSSYFLLHKQRIRSYEKWEYRVVSGPEPNLEQLAERPEAIEEESFWRDPQE